ncbi:UNVERIFIED_CONTAM: hypothetical protein Sradi_5876000 [Sesamum radiatum]|uniref:Reverse transcriptase RNase H-like domain-containing protein n=1 Tax=Sesamum radiatum TaxID=300843 RepID=A0AAW2KTX5_SESRA
MGKFILKGVRELKQVCSSNLPKLAIPKDENELVVYTDANDYHWEAVLMKKTATREEPCRYTGGLFSEQQAQVWHINEKEFFVVWKAFKKWPLFLLAKEFTLKVDNTNVKAFLKHKLDSKIEKIVIRTSLLASTSLWNDLKEPIQKESPSRMTRELREHDPKHTFTVQGSKPVALDSSTNYTKPSPDSQGVKTFESTQHLWGKWSHPAFHIKLQRSDMIAFNKIKAASGEAPLVSAVKEDDISTRRAWGLLVYLTEIDMSSIHLRSFQTNEWIIPVKFHDGKNH